MSADIDKVLVVEDDPDIQQIAEMALEAIGGFTVKICGSGPAALAEAAAFAPDMILLDVMMPGMDGPATLAALRRLPALAAVPVVFMTAKVQGAEIDSYRALGAAGVIPKPFDPVTLADQVRAFWRQARGTAAGG